MSERVEQEAERVETKRQAVASLLTDLREDSYAALYKVQDGEKEIYVLANKREEVLEMEIDRMSRVREGASNPSELIITRMADPSKVKVKLSLSVVESVERDLREKRNVVREGE